MPTKTLRRHDDGDEKNRQPKRPPMPDDKPVSAWGDNSNRFPDDKKLRDAGFQIVSRPKHGPAVWRRGDLELPFDAALAFVVREAVRKNAEEDGCFLPD